MAEYRYIAKNAAGQDVAGVMQGDSPEAVAHALDQRQLYPVEVAPAQPRTRRGRRVRARHVAVLYQQMADLLTAGVPALQALDVVARATPSKALAQVVRDVREEVSGGQTLSDAMASHRAVFPPLHAAIVHAGERAGFLQEALANLGDFLERQDELAGKVRGALVYPILLTAVGALLVVIILLVLVPKFQPIFATMEAVPAPTQVLFAVSELLRGYGLLLLALAAGGVTAVVAYVRSPAGRRVWDRVRLRIPVFGRAMRMVAITRFCRILGTMLRNGVGIVQALSIAKSATGSTVLRDAVEQAAENVRAGQSLAAPLRASGLFPVEIVEMIAVAEEANQLDRVLVEIADRFERRTNRQVDVAVRLIEPLVLVLIAGVVALVAIGLLYPVFTLTQALSR